LNSGGTLPAVMNAANEIAFNKFRQAEIKFTDIWKLIEKVMELHQPVNNPSLEDIFAADNWARIKAEELSISRFMLKI
jgi:1-deoxy-D-xylulose-5-phosphate reductoisomerase